MRRFKIKKGFLLVEAIISITILLMVAATAVGLLIMANRAINFNANSLEASWIAQEGINSFRGLRDTNWIRFSYDKENCWKIRTDNCAPANVMATDNYILNTSTTAPPTLTPGSAALDLTDGIDPSDEDYLLYYQADGTVSHAVTIEPSRFYRMIAVTTDPLNPNRIDAICTVQWREGGRTREVNLPISITNFALE